MPEPSMTLDEAQDRLHAITVTRPTQPPLVDVVTVDIEKARYTVDLEPSGHGSWKRLRIAQPVRKLHLACGHTVQRDVAKAYRVRCGWCFEAEDKRWRARHKDEIDALQAVETYWQGVEEDAELEVYNELVRVADSRRALLVPLFERLGIPDADKAIDFDPDGDDPEATMWEFRFRLTQAQCASLILRLETMPDWVDARDEQPAEG